MNYRLADVDYTLVSLCFLRSSRTAVLVFLAHRLKEQQAVAVRLWFVRASRRTRGIDFLDRSAGRNNIDRSIVQ